MKTTDQNTVLAVTQVPKATADLEKLHIIEELQSFLTKRNCGVLVVELAFNQEVKQKKKAQINWCKYVIGSILKWERMCLHKVWCRSVVL